MSPKPNCKNCTTPNCAECVSTTRNGISRRQFIKGAVCGSLALSSVGAVLSACAPTTPTAESQVPVEPTTAPSSSPTRTIEGGTPKTPEQHTGDLPAGTGSVDIRSIGTFPFEANQVETRRQDIFQPGHFSLFDILAHLNERGDIALEAHFEEELDTHVIDAIDGRAGWWYQAHYSRGWYESNAFRMDMYPYKNNSQIQVFPEDEERVARIYDTFREEVVRLADHGGQIVIPALNIRAVGAEYAFQNVAVTPHDVRSDVLQPGVATALDALISLADEGKLPNLKLTWYERIGNADPVDSYWVEGIDEARAHGGCGFVYETGSRTFSGFSGSHIHIPSDVRVTVSPEYALWFWICL